MCSFSTPSLGLGYNRTHGGKLRHIKLEVSMKSFKRARCCFFVLSMVVEMGPQTSAPRVNLLAVRPHYRKDGASGLYAKAAVPRKSGLLGGEN